MSDVDPNADQVLTLTAEQVAELRGLVRRDDPDGYQIFYTLVFNQPMPSHVRRQVEKVYAARAEGVGSIVRGFRGSTKTTAFSIGFLAYQIGLHPEGSSLMIQASDAKAAKNTAQVASIIESNPMWKLFFPEVVPDKEMAWGAAGYEVKRTDQDYGEFRRSRTPDPSFVGYGVASSTLIGSHPTLLMIIDDINDEENTRSVRESEHVNTKLRGTILPMAVKGKTWELVLCTPWTDNDAAATLEGTGAYEVIETPVFEVVAAGTEGAEYVDELHPMDKDFRGKWVRLSWPEVFTLAVVKAWRKLLGQVEFARMFLLDLRLLKAGKFRWQTYPSSAVDPTWPVGGGADYAGTVNQTIGNDFFAHCYLAQPGKFGGVVIGGVRENCTQAQAERYLMQAQSLFPNWLDSVLEGDGKGEEFFAVVMRNPGLRVRMLKTGNQSKQERLLRQMGPYLENGVVRISDADTPFLNRLREELEKWPMLENEDCLDALYWAMRGMPQILVMADEQAGGLPNYFGRERESAGNPFSSLAQSEFAR